MNMLQTLDRGLLALEIIAQRDEGISIADLAAKLAVHRAIAYRIATTLESHGLIARSHDGRLHLGAGISALAARFEPQFHKLARPMLYELAQATEATAFISVAQGEECIAIMVAEPEAGLLRVGYRVGSRHPLTRGAAGIAILAGRPEHAADADAVRQARRDGFCVTRGQLQRGAVGVASPIHAPARAGFEASLGVVAMDDLDVARASSAVTEFARRLAHALGL